MVLPSAMAMPVKIMVMLVDGEQGFLQTGLHLVSPTVRLLITGQGPEAVLFFYRMQMPLSQTVLLVIIMEPHGGRQIATDMPVLLI